MKHNIRYVRSMNPSRRVPRLLAVFVGLLAFSNTSLHAGVPLGGLTVAVSPDGGKLVAAGDTRTLLVLDPETLEVKERHWVQVAVTSLAFNADGSVLAVLDSSESVHLFDTDSWTKKAELSKRADLATNGELLVGQNENYSGPSVYVHTFADGAEKAAVSYPKGVRIAALALSDDGSKFAVLTAGEKDDSEKVVPYNKIPKTLEGIAKDEFKQKNDGKTSTLFVHDAATGKQLSEARLYFTVGGNAAMFFDGDNVKLVNYSNLNATVTPSGEITLFQLDNSYNYGIGTSWDKSLILTGGLRNFSLTKTDTLVAVKGDLDRLPSFPEYWKGFAATADGAIYGATSAYRVVKLTPDGVVDKAVPIK